MKIIYSNEIVEGLDGSYFNPLYFSGINAKAVEVFTDDDKIAKAYKDADIKVSPLSKPKAKAKGKK